MVPMLMGNAVLFVGSLIAMAVLSPLLTLVALAVAPPCGSSRSVPAHAVPGELGRAAAGGRRRGGGRGRRDRRARGEGLRAGGAGGGADRAGRPRLYASRVRTVRLMARYNPALQAVPALGQVGVLALGGWLALHGTISAGHVPGLLLLPGGAGRAGYTEAFIRLVGEDAPHLRAADPGRSAAGRCVMRPVVGRTCCPGAQAVIHAAAASS